MEPEKTNTKITNTIANNSTIIKDNKGKNQKITVNAVYSNTSMYEAELAKLMELINNTNDPEAKEFYDTFELKIREEKPEKTVLKSLLSNIKGFLPTTESSLNILNNLMSIINNFS